MRERSYSWKSQWNSVDHTCTKNSWNPIYNAEPIRPWSAYDPTMIRPHTRPSRTRRTAEVDHRGSGTHFEWKNIGFRASAISPKTHFVRDFLHNSIGNSSTSTTCNPILYCGNDPRHANHNGIPSATHPPAPLCNPIYNAGTILQLQITMEFCGPHVDEKQLKPQWSAHVPTLIPTTHETVSHPSHRRGRSSRFGDALCMEKHRVSCICYLSKMHFVRDFLQNSIGNSSTSTTCNPIYIAGTILEWQITMEFHRQLIHQHHLQPHLQCGNDPTVGNHNGILSTTRARKTVETPFTMRNRSDHDPPMIRPWSDHTRDRLAPVAPQR